MLAGMPAAPTLYNPRLNCAMGDDGNCLVDDQGRTVVTGAAKDRQQQVLELMVQHHRVSAEGRAQAASGEVLHVYPASNELLAPAWIDDQVEPRLVRMCEAGLLPRTPGTRNCSASVHVAAVPVTTTLDLAETARATELAKQFIADGLKAGCDCNDAAIATIDPASGEVEGVRANGDQTNTSDRRVAGDIDELTEINQPGSSFKPAVYLAWMDGLNKTPLSTLWDTVRCPSWTSRPTRDDQVTI